MVEREFNFVPLKTWIVDMHCNLKVSRIEVLAICNQENLMFWKLITNSTKIQFQVLRDRRVEMSKNDPHEFIVSLRHSEQVTHRPLSIHELE